MCGSWWKVKIVNARVKETASGLVPAAYVEEVSMSLGCYLKRIVIMRYRPSL